MKVVLFLISALVLTTCGKNKKPKTPVAVELTASTTAEGVTVGQFDPASSSQQTLTVAAGTAINGTQVILPPGVLSVSTQILVEEGTSAVATVAQSLALPETPAPQAPAVVIRPGDPTLIPKQPLTISLPVPLGAGLLSDAVTVILYIAYTAEGLKAGIIPPEKIALASGKAIFQSSYFGSFQLAKLLTLPATLEAPSVSKIETRVESAKPESFYAIGSQDNVAGYWKDDVWTALSTPGQGISWAYKGIYSGLGDFYVLGTVNMENNWGEPGYWKNGIWSSLKTSQKPGKCNYMNGILVRNILHAQANCEDGVYYWVDGMLTTLAKATPEVNFFEISEFATDGLGNLSIVGAQTIPGAQGVNTVINGEWRNGVWIEFSRGTNSYTDFPYASTVVYSKHKKDFIFAGTNTASDSTVSCFTMINGVRTPLENQSPYISIQTTEESTYITSTRNNQMGYFKDSAFIVLPIPPGFVIEKSLAFDLNVSKKGEIALLGTYFDFEAEPRILISGYWKNGVWTEIRHSVNSNSKRISDILFY